LKPKVTEKVESDVRKLFIGGVPSLTSFNEFKAYFSRFGEIIDVMLPTKSRETKINNGFGFVTFKKVDEAKAVLNFEKPHSIRGKQVR